MQLARQRQAKLALAITGAQPELDAIDRDGFGDRERVDGHRAVQCRLVQRAAELDVAIDDAGVDRKRQTKRGERQAQTVRDRRE